jgi:hypothetical protein
MKGWLFMDIEQIKKQARKEIAEEDFRKAVDEYKEKLRSRRSVWDRIMPFKIIILRKDKI